MSYILKFKSFVKLLYLYGILLSMVVNSGVSLNKNHPVDWLSTVLVMPEWWTHWRGKSHPGSGWYQPIGLKPDGIKGERRKSGFCFFRGVSVFTTAFRHPSLGLQSRLVSVPMQTLQYLDTDLRGTLMQAPGLWFLTEFFSSPAYGQSFSFFHTPLWRYPM